MNKITSVILLLLFYATIAMAQDATQLSYNNAETLYHSGLFDKAEKYLLENINAMKGIHKSSAYRLLALCRIQTGDIEGAKDYTDKLLKADPYYTPTLLDPQRFIDIVNEAKQQETGITTASRQVESIEEAPVPVTVITEDMIRLSGASNLQELLCLYVPGMSLAEGMEANIAMHGISGLTQESILFLQDGHRLNGGSSNAEAPDYRNSLDKIQQIEVLRGPASSLYGNVALTAVVNIITYHGSKLNGGRLSVTTGTQKTYGGAFVVGGGNNVVDITGWGSINSTEGFKHVIENTANPNAGPTTLYAHGFNQRPAYDIGIKARWGDFSMTINSQRSKQVPYFNTIQFAADQVIKYNFGEKRWDIFYQPTVADYHFTQNYNYDRYAQINSNKPGITRTNHHINLDFSHTYGKIDFQASGYVSLENTNFYNALGDSINSYLLFRMMRDFEIVYDSNDVNKQVIQSILVALNKGGSFFDLNWENITLGGQAQILTKYNFLGHGSAIFGMQYEHFALTGGMFNLGFNYSPDMMLTKGGIFDDGMEDIISAYTQIKHYFSNRLILNAGLRYDHKSQQGDNRLDYFSPRISLIHKISNYLSGRTSFNYSFVDAPFLYRSVKLKILGGYDLQPETMKSFQAGLTYHNPKSHLTAECSAYYNLIANLLTMDYTSAGTFKSSERMRQLCAEVAMQYKSSRLMLNSNATWQRVVKSRKGCNIYNGNRLGVPELMGNVAVAWTPYIGQGSGFFSGGKLWLNANISAQSKTYYQMVDFLLPRAKSILFNLLYEMATSESKAEQIVTNAESITSEYNSYFEVKPQVVLGIGATYEWKWFDINITLKNITNNEYLVGSNMSAAVPHAGRQLLGKITVKF